MSYGQKFQLVVFLLALSVQVSAQEYHFYGDSAVEDAEEDGGFSFPPNGYSPYKPRVTPVRPQNIPESMPVEEWGAYPQWPYGVGQPFPWSGYGYPSGGEGAMFNIPYWGGVSPLNTFPGGGFLLPW